MAQISWRDTLLSTVYKEEILFLESHAKVGWTNGLATGQYDVVHLRGGQAFLSNVCLLVYLPEQMNG